MRKYLNKPIGELATELSAGLVRLRKGYVDAAESLLHILEPGGLYPYEFVVYRLTGYRSGGRDVGPPMSGKTLRSDLLTLMLDLCDSFELQPAITSSRCTTSPPWPGASRCLPRRSSDGGVTACRPGGWFFPTARSGVGFLESSVQWFVQNRAGMIHRSVRFTQLTEAERADILRRARRMASFTQCSLSEVAHRIARRTGRAIETIRYTIRKARPGTSAGGDLPADDRPAGRRKASPSSIAASLRGVPAPILASGIAGRAGASTASSTRRGPGNCWTGPSTTSTTPSSTCPTPTN